MIDNDLLARVLCTALSSGGEYADVFVESRFSTAIVLEDDKIERVLSGTDSGIGVRLIVGNTTAFAFSNDFSREALLNLAETLRTAAHEMNGVIRDISLNLKKLTPAWSSPILRHPDTVGLAEKVALVQRGNAVARQYDPAVKQVTVAYRDAVQSVKVVTSDGSIAEDERVYTTALVQVVAMDGATIQTGYEPVGGLIGYELFDDSRIEQAGRKSARRAVSMLKARRAPGGRMPVIISAEAGGTMIHEAIGHGLEADLAQQGLSVYSGKLGQQVASSVVSVVDDATLPTRRGSFAFDDEGTPAGCTVLVENGILCRYMYDRYTASVNGTVSTGNGRRESYEHKPIPRMTNTFIAPGESDPQEIIRSVPKGLLVTKMGGGQVNTITGDFVFEVQEGFLLENGMIGELVRGATLVGNGPEVLKSIDMVGSDLGFSIGTCGKDAQGVPVSDAMPTLRIPEIVVGGEIAG
ncbi:MAG TPA: TldD/PmbA family protein [Dissulfurispiraceae bacterium]|nr:TldD/PmbA family protein [Dissulfurispiraceae bacterium]